MNIRPAFYTLFVAFLIIFPQSASAGSPLAAEELLQTKELKNHLQALTAGEIVSLSRPETESSAELNVIMGILVPAPLETTVDRLNRQANAKNAPGLLSIQEISDKLSPLELDELFNKVTFAPNETGDVRKLMNIVPGDDFNLSAKEIAMVKKHAETGSNDEAAAVKTMAKVMGAVLKNRYLSYRKEGLKGLEPYQLDVSKQVSPAEELISATESLALVKERFPAYYRCLRMYPDQGESNFVHQHFWLKQQEGNRPMFVLKHWILDVQPDYALITERQQATPKSSEGGPAVSSSSIYFLS